MLLAARSLARGPCRVPWWQVPWWEKSGKLPLWSPVGSSQGPSACDPARESHATPRAALGPAQWEVLEDSWAAGWDVRPSPEVEFR